MSYLSLIVLLPMLAAILVAVIPRSYRFVIRSLTLGTTLIVAVLGVMLFSHFETGQVGYQFVTVVPGLGSELLGIQCRLGVDGINIGLILMGAIVAFAAACVSWEIQEKEKEYYFLLLVMTGGILGAFASLDLFFFYFFHEFALVPTFIMIGVWGRGEQRNYAAFKTTLYLSFGALVALAGLIALYFQMPEGSRTFDIELMTRHFSHSPITVRMQGLIFPLLMFGFGILVSLWPFHTWAPLGYGAAPTATAMLHAGVLKKFGLYGLIRIAVPLVPEGANYPIGHFGAYALTWMDLLSILCLGNILHCGLVAIQQKNLNLLIGNSSVAHMGFIFLGIASLNIVGITGAVVIMVAHGFLAALTFGLSGYLYQLGKTLEMERFGGLLKQMPFIGSAMVMAMMAGCGLPGFANFVGEAMVFFGSWTVYPMVTALACWGALVIGAVYMLRAIRTILHGDMKAEWKSLPDAGPWRKVPFVLLLASLLILGVCPGLLTEKIKPSATEIVRLANGELIQKPRKLAENSGTNVTTAAVKSEARSH